MDFRVPFPLQVRVRSLHGSQSAGEGLPLPTSGSSAGHSGRDSLDSALRRAKAEEHGHSGAGETQSKGSGIDAQGQEFHFSPGGPDLGTDLVSRAESASCW